MTIRVLHIADIHYCPTHLKWVDKAMAHAVETAIAEGCHLAVLAGDSFDHGMGAHEPTISAYLRQVLRLAHHMPTVHLQGTHSHDRPGMLDILNAIPTFFPIHVMDRESHVLTVETAAGPVTVAGLPSLNKALPEVQAMGAKAWARQQFETIGAIVSQSPHPSVLVTHGTVTGCKTESGYAMVSPDHEMSIEDLAAAECDAVMLGHIHKHQSWPGVVTPSGRRTTIAYTGSLARLVHGHNDPVGFLIWDIDPARGDIEPGRATFTFNESPARRLVNKEFPGLPDFAELREIAASAGPDDAVRIRYSVDEEHAAAIDKRAIRELFMHCDSVQVEPTVLPVQRVRAEGISRALTLEAKLAEWANTTGSEAQLAALETRLAMLRQMDPEQIVAALTAPPEAIGTEREAA
jgi:exonuclease SbcD